MLTSVSARNGGSDELKNDECQAAVELTMSGSDATAAPAASTELLCTLLYAWPTL